MRWQFFLFCLTVEHNIFSWFQFASVSSPRPGCHCHVNIIDANCLSSRDIIYLVSSSYNVLLFHASILYPQLALCTDIEFNSFSSVSLYTYSTKAKVCFYKAFFFFFFFIAFMTESICLLIYTKREKYMTYIQCCFCLIFT